MKKILGLDLGTNSIGWALIEVDHDKRIIRIIALGSRIIPMGSAEISTYESGGKLKSSAADKTKDKSIRKNISRALLRRDRLHCVLNLLNLLPEHYKLDIEFINEKGKRSGKIIKGREPKIAYFTDNTGKKQFLFQEAYSEMEAEFKEMHPNLFCRKSKKTPHLPYDWTLYYLRKKALHSKLTNEELAWVIMSFLQKRGYEKVMGIDEKDDKKEEKEGELHEVFNAKVSGIEPLLRKSTDRTNTYHIQLVDEYGNAFFSYIEEANYPVTKPNEYKKVEKITKTDSEGNVNEVKVIISEIKDLEIVSVIDKHEFKRNKRTFEIMLDTGWKYDLMSSYFPKITGTRRDFVICSEYDQTGKLQKPPIITMPNEDSMQLAKMKTETSLQAFNSDNKTVGVASYIYDAILHNPTQKIKAGLVETIERDYYKQEFQAIIKCQELYHPELCDKQNYINALRLLYPNNETHRNALADQDFSNLLGDDIIFYQRNLKTKKSLIADCKYEFVTYSKDGIEEKKPLKCIARSNPLFQEFRLWKFIKNLHILLKEKENEQGEKLINIDITNEILTVSTRERLFESLSNRKEISRTSLLRLLKLDTSKYTWNFEESHVEPCNETRYDFVRRLKRIKNFDWDSFLCAKSKIHAPKHYSKDNIIIDGPTNEYLLWHFFYSVKKKEERIKGLPNLVEKLLQNAAMDISYRDKVVEMLCTISTYKNGYGSYSEKAIKKLLPFMRLGKYWSQQNIEAIKTVDTIKPEVLEKENIYGEVYDLQGLGESSACYIVYGRYSEACDASHWSQPYDIKKYLQKEFKHYSINNPVVEKVVRETLMVVHDIWTTYGELDGTLFNENNEEIPSYKKFFDQINVEIGTSLKKNKKQREDESTHNIENRKANLRAYEIIKELKTEYRLSELEEHSPYQQEKLRILEAGALDTISRDSNNKVYDYAVETTAKRLSKKEILDIVNKEVSNISPNDILRYRLWLDQRYRCPYTGIYISLSELFDRTKYQIDHVFPQERVTLNSMSNKVICKAIANQAKGAMTGYEFILTSQGKARYNGQEVVLLSPEEYVNNVKDNIKDNKKKEIMLSKVIPAKFGSNQLANSQYIAKLAMGLLSNIVREDGENEYKSRNVLVISGSVTTKLKKDWQLDETWNELILPRFQRVNTLLDENEVQYVQNKIINGHEVSIPVLPDNSIDKKRIDHRHHALDALIVALATSNHVNYINNISGLDVNSERIRERKDLKAKYMITKHLADGSKKRIFLPPMQYKTGQDIIAYKYAYKDLFENAIFKRVALIALQNTIVTFKQNNRLMRQRSNYILNPEHNEHVQQAELNKKKNYSIRQSLHKQTYYGLREFCPKPIEEAIKNPKIIIEGKVRSLIQQLKDQGKSKEEIINSLKSQYPVVSVYEECVTTQWSHQLEKLSEIREKEVDKKTQKTGKPSIIREIECIADITIQNILKKHLAKYDSIKVPIVEAIKCYDDIISEDQKAIVDEYLVKGTTKETHVNIYIKDRDTKGMTISHNPQIAFSADGIKDMNSHIVELNNDKPHMPIYQVKMTQAKGKMFLVSEPEKGKPLTAKNKQYVTTDADSNRFCGIYKDKNGNTETYMPSLRETIAAIKSGERLMPLYHPKKIDYVFHFCLAPLDMVYMPNKEEIESGNITKNSIDITRIYVVNNFTGSTVYFRPYYYASAIVEKEIDLRLDEKGKLAGSVPDKTANCDGLLIRDHCIPIKVDRLGNIIELNGVKV